MSDVRASALSDLYASSAEFPATRLTSMKASRLFGTTRRNSGHFPFREGTVGADSAAYRFWSELQDLYAAAGKPTLSRLVRLGSEQRPQISISDSTINAWLNRKAVPAGPKNERYLAVLVAFLQSRLSSDAQYKRLPPGEWGRLLRDAQTERSAAKRRGRPGHPPRPPRSMEASDQPLANSPSVLIAGPAVAHPIASVPQQAPHVPVAFPWNDGEFVPAAPGVLVGRDRELSTLARLVAGVVSGQGGAVLVEGEPGIGKSALVRTALTRAAGLGCQVHWGTGDELGQALPFQPLLDGLNIREPSADTRRNTIAGLLRGEIVTDRGSDLGALLAEQLLMLIADQVSVRPTILVLDDLQWADKDTLRLWARLTRAVHQVPLLLIAIMRPIPRRADLLAVRQQISAATRISLTGLTSTAVADLVAAHSGGRPDRNLLSLAAGAAGNPLYLTELINALNRNSMITINSAGIAELHAGSVPGSLHAAIADRLGFVSEQVREVLRAAALLGVDFAVADLAILLNRNVADLVQVLDEARAAGVLAESGNRLGFRHPLIWSALYDAISAPVLAAWHREAARTLAAAGAPADRVARQLLLSARASDGFGDLEPADEWVMGWLTSAADMLIGQAPQVAADLLRQVTTRFFASSAQGAWVASRLADALYRIGHLAQAERVASRALEDVTDSDLIVDLHWTLAQCRMLAGRSAASLSSLEAALASPGLQVRHRARLHVLAARTHCNLGAVEQARQAATHAIASASESGDSWGLAWALHVLTLVTTVKGDFADALPLFDRAVQATQADPNLTDLRLLLQINQAVTLGALDQHEKAFPLAQQTRHLARQVGTAMRMAQAHSALAQLLFQTGRWDEALTEVQFLPESLQAPDVACVNLGISALIAFHRDDIRSARDHLAAAVPHDKLIGRRPITSLALARSRDREQGGALRQALAILIRVLDSNADDLGEVEDLFPDAVRLAVTTGNLNTAQALTGNAVTFLAQSDIPHRRAHVLYCQGFLEQSVSKFLSAADCYKDATRPHLYAQAIEAAVRESLRTGNQAKAQGLAAEAADVYVRLGAKANLDRLEAML